MNKKQQEREERLLPNGQPRYVRIYDNNEETFDRYTVVFTGNYKGKSGHLYLGMSDNPRHPQGFCCHGEHVRPIDTNNSGYAPKIGSKNHLGKRIPFTDLPYDCREIILEDYKDIWEIKQCD